MCLYESMLHWLLARRDICALPAVFGFGCRVHCLVLSLTKAKQIKEPYTILKNVSMVHFKVIFFITTQLGLHSCSCRILWSAQPAERACGKLPTDYSRTQKGRVNLKSAFYEHFRRKHSGCENSFSFCLSEFEKKFKRLVLRCAQILIHFRREMKRNYPTFRGRF